jgi:hypothetical protein
MRGKLEAIMGPLHASLYTSTSAKFVESGALFTIWATSTLAVIIRGSIVKHVFVLPAIHILVRIPAFFFFLSRVPV